MRRTDRIALLLLVIAFAMSFSLPSDRAPAPEPVADPGLTFEERVAAEEAIERVYYAHQIGATEPFETAVPYAALEDKVRTILEKLATLEANGNATGTEALDAELARMEAQSRMPDRLHEIFSALGNDRRLMRECVARPALLQKAFRRIETTTDAAAASFPALDDATLPGPLPAAPSCTDAWQGLANPLAPARTSHSAVWTGSLMLLWGGKIGNAVVGNGARYDPATDTWSFMSSVNQPTRRTDNVALWTGTRLIIWGGLLYPDYNNTGGRYDPLTDTWTGMSGVSAPSPRAYATAVWTGTRMILWGGATDTILPLNDGGLYDPATDSWTPTPANPSLTGRSSHVAVWTGREMIVWGGYTFPATSLGGSRYDPVAGSWLPLATAGQPDRRIAPSAVWTGSQMIVWGGWVQLAVDAYLKSGGRYDPATDAWTPTSTAGAPDGRTSHTAIWTGHQMVVWGGRNATGNLNSGGRYNPAANAWTAATTSGAPSARVGHSAVWTGTRMLVWGGNTSTQTFANGGVYDPGEGGGDFDGDGYSACAGDCNDDDASISPGARESCNGRDDNCNDQVDEGFGSSTCGVGACERSVDNCVDGAPQACVPGAPGPEICNGLDDDCDGLIDEGPDALDSDADGIPDACDACPLDPANDADGDGVCGDIDQCAASSLGGTVRIGDCDSGVGNDLLADGCSLQDRVNGCTAGTKIVGKAARCIAAVTNDLVERGLLTGRDKGRIQSCAGGRVAPGIPHSTRQTTVTAVRPSI
jgi:hypothetical protein